MADLNHGQSREAPQTLWRRLGKPIRTRVNALHQRLARRRETEVFPWLEHLAVVAAILGASVGFGIGRVRHLETIGLIDITLLGVIAGVLIGIGLSPAWGVQTPEPVAGPAAEPVTLWDPWLDDKDEGGNEASVEEALSGSAPLVDGGAGASPEEQVRVRPRVISSESGESMPLEVEIGPFLANHDRGAICVTGPPGAGKSLALSYLARRLPPHFEVSYLDHPLPLALGEAADRGLVVFALSGRASSELLAEFTLAPWSKDEWIEYLLAADRNRCASVMARLARREPEQGLLQGLPELWRIVLDRMVDDESIEGPRQALRLELGRHLPDRELRGLVENDCLTALIVDKERRHRALAYLRQRCPDTLFRLVRHRAIQVLMAADRIADGLAQGAGGGALIQPLPRDLVHETALRIADRPEAVASLKRLIAAHEERWHPMTASLLHALRVGWKPDRPPPCLKGAFLAEAAWPGIELAGADLRYAELDHSNLRAALLDRARLDDAQLAGADLRTASLLAACCTHADLSRARLAGVQARGILFDSACLRATDLESSLLDEAILRGADLRDARLVEASLIGADLSQARLDGADFTGADLSRAVLTGLDLSHARLDKARFTGAKLLRCNLENLELPEASFIDADLSNALLTGSCMPDADFRNARLRAAGLAEVDWVRADLRNADLREAAFHLGSSRSGRVDSATPCEGSRTGFYTDEYDEQGFKSPEEIRKANLRGADLRGARIDGVDFYLVDLRDALVDPDQVLHLRRCGAILETRD